MEESQEIHAFEKFIWKKGESHLIEYYMKNNDLRKENKVIKYSLYRYIDIKDFYLCYFLYPTHSIMTKHIEIRSEQLKENSEILEAITETGYLEFILTKRRELDFGNPQSDYNSTIKSHSNEYMQFENKINLENLSLLANLVSGITVFSDRSTSKIVILFVNWINEKAFRSYSKNHHLQELIKQNIEVKNLESGSVGKEIYSWIN